ncbi:MAG: hypothetical protein LBB58_04400 [Cellulomonadaceae bacterium]|nr:hypothetical protein [Cellulomonadaceae bacterium]
MTKELGIPFHYPVIDFWPKFAAISPTLGIPFHHPVIDFQGAADHHHAVGNPVSSSRDRLMRAFTSACMSWESRSIIP